MLSVYSADDSIRVHGRTEEREAILTALNDKDTKLLYICGQPGVGKTSCTLNVLKENFEEEELFLFNAMRYKDLGEFSLQLLK